MSGDYLAEPNVLGSAGTPVAVGSSSYECPTGPVGPRRDGWKMGVERRFELAPPQPPTSRNRPPRPGGEEASVRSGPAGAPTVCGSSSYEPVRSCYLTAPHHPPAWSRMPSRQDQRSPGGTRICANARGVR